MGQSRDRQVVHFARLAWGGNFDAQGKREYIPVAGDILIQTGCFCGKPATPCLEFREEDETAVKQFLGIV